MKNAWPLSSEQQDGTDNNLKTSISQGIMNSPDADKDDKGSSIKSLLLSFCEYTTAQGFGRLHDSISKKTILRKIFWTLSLLVSFSACIYQTYELVEKVRARPLSTKISVQNYKEIPFPSVTICNLNMLRQSALDSIFSKEQIDTYIDDYSDDLSVIDEDGDDYVFEIDGCDINDDFCVPDNLTIDNIPQSNRIDVLLADYNQTELYRIGHTFENFINSCQWKGGIKCNTGKISRLYWRRMWDPSLGNCYIFNSGTSSNGKKTDILKVRRAGPNYGLELQLNIEQDEYVGELTSEAGVRVLIAESGEMPFPGKEGFSIGPGFANKIGLRMTTIKRKDPFENGTCIDSREDKSNIYFQKYNTKYSIQTCLESCLANRQNEYCGCSEQKFPTNNFICHPLDLDQANCIRQVNTDFLNSKLNCSTMCQHPCRKSTFQQTMSSAVWPSAAAEYRLLTSLFTSNGTNGTNANNETQLLTLRENYLRLSIYFEDLNVSEILEELAYDWADFAADVGGLLGLYVGITALTVLEVFELIVFIFHRLVKRCARPKTACSESNNDLAMGYVNS